MMFRSEPHPEPFTFFNFCDLLLQAHCFQWGGVMACKTTVDRIDHRIRNMPGHGWVRIKRIGQDIRADSCSLIFATASPHDPLFSTAEKAFRFFGKAGIIFLLPCHFFLSCCFLKYLLQAGRNLPFHQSQFFKQFIEFRQKFLYTLYPSDTGHVWKSLPKVLKVPSVSVKNIIHALHCQRIFFCEFPILLFLRVIHLPEATAHGSSDS